MSQGSSSKKFPPQPQRQKEVPARPDKAPEKAPSRAELVQLAAKVKALAEKHPEKAAKILADWMAQDDKKGQKPSSGKKSAA